MKIENVTDTDIDAILRNLKKRLKRGQPSDAVANTFASAITSCPQANPSDVWQHVIYRGVLALGFSDQQWKRISGFALERALTQIYTPRLEPYGLRIRGMLASEASSLFKELGLAGDVKKDKLDRIVEICRKKDYKLVAGLHIKASIAERIQDDVPTSRALMDKGILSIMLTMDSKSYPPPHGDGINYGELGGRSWGDDTEKARIKRQHIEIDGQFDALISYNLRTPPSPEITPSGKKIYAISLGEKQPDVLVRLLKERADTLN